MSISRMTLLAAVTATATLAACDVVRPLAAGGTPGGHAAGFADPTTHGPAAIATLTSCQGCHGTTFAGGPGHPSCNDCHAAAGFADWQSNCTFCHGTLTKGYTAADLVKAAPPRGRAGQTATTDLAVGAHQSHLGGGAIAGPVACAECHVVPGDLSHVDGKPASVRFGALSPAGAWDRTAATCSNVYCHGATLSAGGSLTVPTWTKVDGTQDACGTCHGVPPPSHAQSLQRTDCATCHPETVDAAGNILVAGGKHIDGQLQVAGGHPSGAAWADPTQHGYAAVQNLAGCTTCHGADYGGGTTGFSCNACHATALAGDWKTNCTFCHGTKTPSFVLTAASLVTAAPPVGVHGETATTSAPVGAHQSHLGGGAVAGPVACAECHAVPADLGHVNGQPASVRFGALSPTGAWDPATATCSNVYCHGATLLGGSITVPAWTKVDGTQDACGTCHGVPPPSHVQTLLRTDCVKCHPQTVDASGNILVAGGKHVDGQIEVTGFHPAGWADPTQHGWNAELNIAGCTACHGTDYAGGTTGFSCNACHATALAGDWKTNCTFCHGAQTPSFVLSAASLVLAAPPLGVQGETATTSAAVGAHQKHLNAATYATPIACGTCHVVPTNPLGHFGGTSLPLPPVTPAFSGVANAGSTTSSYGGGTCVTYCHGANGATLQGGSVPSPVWAGASSAGSALACDACHGISPPTGHHSVHYAAGYGCDPCHALVATVGRPAGLLADKSLHVNGTKNVDFSKAYGSGIGGTYNPATHTCNNGCHSGPMTW